MFLENELSQCLREAVKSAAPLSDLVCGVSCSYCVTGRGVSVMPVTAGDASVLSGCTHLIGHEPTALVEGLFSPDAWMRHLALSVVNATLDAARRDAAAPLLPGSLATVMLQRIRPLVRGSHVVVGGGELGRTLAEGGIWFESASEPGVEEVLRACDWVLLSSEVLIEPNGTRLMDVAREATLVLFGPATPWLPDLADLGVDYLVGVGIDDEAAVREAIAENRFDPATQLKPWLLELATTEMDWLDTAIADLVVRRETLKGRVASWQATAGAGRCPLSDELAMLDQELSQLDSRYSSLWFEASRGERGRAGQVSLVSPYESSFDPSFNDGALLGAWES